MYNTWLLVCALTEAVGVVMIISNSIVELTMNNFEDNRHESPPSYEAAIGSNANASGISQATGKFGPFPPSPQPSSNPAYIPQTVNPILPNPSVMHPEPHTIPVIVGVPIFGPHSCTMTCPSCNKAIVTETRTHAGLLAFTICGVLLLFGCWLGCCLIPFCINDCLIFDALSIMDNNGTASA
ncbi:Lipopolysaccharide-induced tumor necrosis factor-alpha factor [Dirofilaria immitis]